MYCYWKYFLIVCFNFILVVKAEGKNWLSGNKLLQQDNFGPVQYQIEKMELCKGPKRRDCGNNSLTFDKPNQMVEFKFEIQTENVRYLKTKIAMYRDKNSTMGAPDIVKWSNDPCSHFIFGQATKSFFNAHNKCSINKGLYKLKMNMTAIFYDLIGTQFFYGTFWAQSVGLSKDCNIFCLRNQFILEKRVKVQSAGHPP